MNTIANLDGFEMFPVSLEREWLISIDTPTAGVDPILEAHEREIPMVQGHYDCCTLVCNSDQI